MLCVTTEIKQELRWCLFGSVFQENGVQGSHVCQSPCSDSLCSLTEEKTTQEETMQAESKAGLSGSEMPVRYTLVVLNSHTTNSTSITEPWMVLQ